MDWLISSALISPNYSMPCYYSCFSETIDWLTSSALISPNWDNPCSSDPSFSDTIDWLTSSALIYPNLLISMDSLELFLLDIIELPKSSCLAKSSNYDIPCSDTKEESTLFELMLLKSSISAASTAASSAGDINLADYCIFCCFLMGLDVVIFFT